LIDHGLADSKGCRWARLLLEVRINVIRVTKTLANAFTSTETKKTSWDKPADFDAPSSVEKFLDFVEASADDYTAAFVRTTSMEGVQDP